MADELVNMQKDDVIIAVHPSVVEEHKRLGWVVVTETEAEQAETEAPVNVEDKPANRKSSKKS